VQAILAATGREGKRNRLLPASMMVYYVIALGLFVGVGCREVLRRLLDGATWIWPNQVRVATESAITQARQRLGSVPIEGLYEQEVVPIAKKTTRGAWYRLWRVVTLDGFTLDVAESEDNVKAFGRPGASRGRSAYPQTRVVGFVENGTHVFFGAEMDRYNVGETTIARRILKKLRPGQFLSIDKRASAQTHISVRVFDVTRPAPGVVLPGVREEEFSSSALQFLNVPVPTPEAAVLLRVYEANSQPGATVTVRVFRVGDNLQDVPLAEEVLPLFYRGTRAATPGYLQYSLPSTSFPGPLRVEVTPNSADEALWAFITVTNPLTSEVTPVFAH
jgi:hypothetical protein